MTGDVDGIGVGDVAATAVFPESQLGLDSLENWDGKEADNSSLGVDENENST